MALRRAKLDPRGCAVCASAAWAWAEEARVCGAEALGAALLVLLSCGAAGGAGARAAAAGAAVGALVQCFDHVSGAMFNPCVTLAAALWGRVSPARAAVAVAAQLAGAAAGAGALRLAAPGADAVSRPARGAGAALAAEAACGAVLALANCAAWDARTRRLRDSWPLRIALTVAALTLFAADISGASMNPARSFGPALLAGDFTDHWVYWAGPLGGSALCTALYVCAWRERLAPCDCDLEP